MKIVLQTSRSSPTALNPRNPRGAQRMTGKKNNPMVDRYIASCPAPGRQNLREIRRVIRGAVPDADEVFSYGMPGYSYPDHPYKGMVARFLLRSSFIGLYVHPPTIRANRALLAGYVTTKAAVHIPLEKPIPTRLIQTRIRANAKIAMAA